MERQLIISVGREFGSGGHEIAEKLAKHYGLKILDHNLLDEIAAERQHMNVDEV
ncbi:MAG: cytidylate kinase family protein, partial [Agathobacter sp.]|nr:cytidylate kinase family protein [Agathobacter sp.]